MRRRKEEEEEEEDFLGLSVEWGALSLFSELPKLRRIIPCS